MKFKFLFFLAACLFFAGCSGDNEIKIGENLSAEQQQIAFRAVLENQYKAGDYKSAFANFEKIAAQGNDDAAFFVALSYNKGRGVNKDTKKGLEMLKTLAEKGYPAAKDALAKELKANADKNNENLDDWLKVTEENAENGDRRAWERLADFYEKSGDKAKSFYYKLGLAKFFYFNKADPLVAKAFLSDKEGTEKDLAEAIHWIFCQTEILNASETLNAAAPEDRKIINFIISQKLAEEKDRKHNLRPTEKLAAAQNQNVFQLKTQEIHFALEAKAQKQHDAIALLKLFLKNTFEAEVERLAKAKDAKGLYELAIDSYKLSSVVFNGMEHAHKVLVMAAEMGNTEAMLELGNIYSRKIDSESARIALNYFLQAAKAGDGRAFTIMARMFTSLPDAPDSVRETFDKIILDAFEKGIAAKDAKAMQGMTRFLLNRSAEQNLPRIIELLKESSAQNNLEACFDLANIYLFKSKTDQRQQAYILLETAAKGGHFASLELLFKENNKDCSNYSPEQIKEWLKNSSNEDRSKAYIFLMQHYLEAGKYLDAYRWVASAQFADLDESQKILKNELSKKISEKISEAEIITIMQTEVLNKDKIRQQKHLGKVEELIKTDLGLILALLRYGLFESYGNFEDRTNHKPILTRLQSLAEKDPAFYGFFLGAIYSRSYSPYYDIDKAISTLKASASKGNPYAMTRLARIFQRRGKKLFESAEADALLAKAAKFGVEEAQLQVAYRHQSEGDSALALNMFAELAKNGNTWAMLALADIYEKGIGTEKDIYRAMTLYQQVARRYLALYPFYERARAEWGKDPQAEATGEFILDNTDPAEAAAESMIRIDSFFKKILQE